MLWKEAYGTHWFPRVKCDGIVLLFVFRTSGGGGADTVLCLLLGRNLSKEVNNDLKYGEGVPEVMRTV